MLALSSHHSIRNLAIIDRGNGSYEPMDTDRARTFTTGLALSAALSALAIFAPASAVATDTCFDAATGLRCRSR